MARKRYTADQIVSILRKAERDLGTKEACRKQGVIEQTFYLWKKQYGGLGISDVHRIKQLEKENRRLKQLVGDQAPEWTCRELSW